MSDEAEGEDHLLQYAADMLAQLETMMAGKISPTSMCALSFTARLLANEADIDRIKTFRRDKSLSEV